MHCCKTALHKVTRNCVDAMLVCVQVFHWHADKFKSSHHSNSTALWVSAFARTFAAKACIDSMATSEYAAGVLCHECIGSAGPSRHRQDQNHTSTAQCDHALCTTRLRQTAERQHSPESQNPDL